MALSQTKKIITMHFLLIKLCRNIVLNSSVFVIAILLLAGCQKEAIQTLPERNWQMVWSDEFEGAAGTSPDPSNWVFDIGTGQGGWGNGEFQYYTDRPENVSLDGNGNLMITAIRESYAGSSFTSGRIKTKGLFDQAYGRFEASIKTPYGPGIWPAFWMLGSNIDTKPWPECGEIDIMELRGQEPNIINGTIHGPGYSGGNSITKKYAFPDRRFDQDFHIFAVEWSEDKIDFFVDDYLYFRITSGDVPGDWVYNTPFFILLNVAVGGNYVGFPTVDTPFPQTMYIDYVRVYESAD